MRHVNLGALLWPAWLVLSLLAAAVWNGLDRLRKRRLRKRAARKQARGWPLSRLLSGEDLAAFREAEELHPQREQEPGRPGGAR